MDSNPLTSIFDRADSNYIIRDKADKANKANKANNDPSNTKTKTKNGQRQGNVENAVDDKVGDKVEKKTFEDKKMESQFYQITNEETRRLNTMKTRRSRIDELKLMEGTGIKKTIEDEINATLKKKNWRSLDLCFKWNLINEYITSLRLNDPDLIITEEDMQVIKNQVIQKMSQNVVYNKENHSIECLNFTTDKGVEI